MGFYLDMIWYITLFILVAYPIVVFIELFHCAYLYINDSEYYDDSVIFEFLDDRNLWPSFIDDVNDRWQFLGYGAIFTVCWIVLSFAWPVTFIAIVIFMILNGLRALKRYRNHKKDMNESTTIDINIE